MKNGIKKEDSLMLYGLAILMMIYHHLFATPNRLASTDYFSILNTLFSSSTEQRVAWLFRLCVAFYAFISGYGICTKLLSTSIQTRCSFKSIYSNYKTALSQCIKLLKKYWIVYIIFIPIGLAIGRIDFSFDLISPQALLGISKFYNAEWWYISQYFTMLALFPIFDFVLCNTTSIVEEKIVKRYKHGHKIVIAILLGLGIIFALFRNSVLFSWFIPQLDNGRFVFTLVFFVGYLCAYFHLFEFGTNNALFQKLRPFIALFFIIICVSIRYIRAYDAVYCKYDAFITAPLVYAICTLLSYLKIVPALLRRIGKYSTYIWLTHSFFCFYYFSHVIVKAQISILMFISLTIFSLLTAYLLTQIEKAITIFFSRNKTV